MLSLKAHAIISGALFAVIIVGAIVGNIAHDSGVLVDGSGLQFAVMISYFTLFILFGYSLIPLMVKLVLAGQAKLGNSGVGLVRASTRHQNKIVIGLWVLITAGLAIAIPAAVKDGIFSPDPAAEPSRGTLVVRPGMTVDEMRRLSSLPIKGSPESVLADANLFDFAIAGTGISFAGCRYYYMTTAQDDRTRIANISVGTSPNKLSRGQLRSAATELRERLIADGWLVAYEKTRTEEERRLHGGAAGPTNGNIWLNGDTVLRIMARRLDDEKPDEDAANAGDWIQFVELSARQNYSGIERYEFAKPR